MPFRTQISTEISNRVAKRLAGIQLVEITLHPRDDLLHSKVEFENSRVHEIIHDESDALMSLSAES